MSRAVLAVLAALVLPSLIALTPGSARAADPCADLGKIAARVEALFSKHCAKAGDKIDCAKIENAADKVREIVEAWNSVFKDTPAALGPRNFEFGKLENGKLIVGGARTFISTLPAKGKVEVEVTKEGGKAAQVAICTLNGAGKSTGVAALNFVENDRGAKSREFDAAGKIVVVRLDAKGTAAFDYKLLVK